jgi:hypothetical protein
MRILTFSSTIAAGSRVWPVLQTKTHTRRLCRYPMLPFSSDATAHLWPFAELGLNIFPMFINHHSDHMGKIVGIGY